jgi:hypothetical protein
MNRICINGGIKLMRLRLLRLIPLAVAALSTAIVLTPTAAQAGPASSRPADGVSTQSIRCTARGDLAYTYYGVSCSAGWWEAFDYRAWVDCTDGARYYGPWHNTFGFPGESLARCPRGWYVWNEGMNTR